MRAKRGGKGRLEGGVTRRSFEVVFRSFSGRFSGWVDRWADKVGGHFGKSGWTKVGSRGCKKLTEANAPFWRL